MGFLSDIIQDAKPQPRLPIRIMRTVAANTAAAGPIETPVEPGIRPAPEPVSGPNHTRTSAQYQSRSEATAPEPQTAKPENGFFASEPKRKTATHHPTVTEETQVIGEPLAPPKPLAPSAPPPQAPSRQTVAGGAGERALPLESSDQPTPRLVPSDKLPSQLSDATDPHRKYDESVNAPPRTGEASEAVISSPRTQTDTDTMPHVTAPTKQPGVAEPTPGVPPVQPVSSTEVTFPAPHASAVTQACPQEPPVAMLSESDSSLPAAHTDPASSIGTRAIEPATDVPQSVQVVPLGPAYRPPPPRKPEPTVQIGQVDILVSSPPPAHSRSESKAKPGNIASRRYLRRL